MPVNNFVYATPESQGVPTQALIDFLSEMKENRFPIHSFLFIRHGKVVAEGYCPPFDENRKHRMYSCSKSFTSVAIGMLITEGKLKLDDKVASFFPEYLPENAEEYILEATVEDLLRMATQNEGNAYDWDTPDWTEIFFNNTQPKHKPGTVFHYDTAGTTVLCALVEKITGMKMLDYMRPLLDELGVSPDIWCIETPEGRSWTGSGILATPRDFTRFAMLCLNRGEWNGKQLIDRDYMMKATTRQIDCSTSDFSPNCTGYGYQFWMLREGGFACCGMGGQFAFMMPKYDSILITTADCQSVNGADDFFRDGHQRILKTLAEGELPPCAPEKAAELDALLHLTLPEPVGDVTSPIIPQINGKTYDLDENNWGWKWMRFEFEEGKCTLHYEKKTGVHELPLYIGHYGELSFPDLESGVRIGCKDKHYACVSNLRWERESTLIGKLYCVDDYMGTMNLQFTFEGDSLTAFLTKTAENFFNDYRGYYVGRMRK